MNCTIPAAGRVQWGMDTLESPVLTLGAGNMAHAIVSGAQSGGMLDTDLVGAIDPNADRRALFTHAFAHPAPAVEWLVGCGGGRPLVLLAVKPQMLGDALPPLVESLSTLDAPPCTFVSILAGTRVETISGMVRDGDRVIRVMPNTPAQIGLGMSAIARDNGPDPDDLTRVCRLFAAVGAVVEIPEGMIDAFTAVAGSGPAYVFYLAEGMMRGAESVGFTTEQAGVIVRQTILGSSTLLDRSDELPGDLRAKVTSKNGTTYAATTTLDAHGVMEAIEAAIAAARDRGEELGRSD